MPALPSTRAAAGRGCGDSDFVSNSCVVFVPFSGAWSQERIAAADILALLRSKNMSYPVATVEAMVHEARGRDNATDLVSLREVLQACSFRKERRVVRALPG